MTAPNPCVRLSTMEASKKSKILIVGATGNLGFELAKASLQASHPTFALVRDSSLADPSKALKLQTLVAAGLSVLKGSLADEDGLCEIIKLVDVVICAVSSSQVLDQKPLVRAIKRVGCIKRFIPSEFGADPDRCRVGDLDRGFYSWKSEFRRLVESERIPYTYICCNFFMTYLLPSLVQPGAKVPPREKVTIFGDGTAKGVFVKQSDVAAFTIRTVDDPFTLNKTLYLRPTGNMFSMTELIDIWEEKIGKELQKFYITEEELLKLIKGTPYPECMELVFIYSAMVKGDHTYYDIQSSGGVEGTQLYPEIKYTTISDYLDTLL